MNTESGLKRAQGLIGQVAHIYEETDRLILRFQDATSLYCLEGCGSCCATQTVEATPLEALPLAQEIYRRRGEERVLAELEEREREGSQVCLFYEPDPREEGKGRCGEYSFRPLLCRLFGFAARRNRQGEKEPVFCRLVKQSHPEVVLGAHQAVAQRMEIPIFQDLFQRVASLEPSLGYRLLPINQAVREALEYLYWKQPRDEDSARAS